MGAPIEPLTDRLVVVLGAAGLLGSTLCRALAHAGARVAAFDVRPVDPNRVAGARQVLGDTTVRADLDAVFAGADVVFHCASMILTSRCTPAAHRERAHAVNIGGVQNTLAAARAAGVRAVVYTSTNHVVFSGAAAIDGGDESLPYAADPRDVYTRTKIAAEQAVLAAADDALATCALRPGGIYGAGECMLLDRLEALYARGLPNLQFGAGTARVDFVHVDRCAEAHLEAARRLLDPARRAAVAGEAFFISDASPLNHAEFVRLVIRGLGGEGRPRRLPGGLMRAVAWLAEAAYAGLRRPAPAVTVTEIETCLTTNTYSTAKARARLDYHPIETAVGLASIMAARRQEAR